MTSLITLQYVYLSVSQYKQPARLQAPQTPSRGAASAAHAARPPARTAAPKWVLWGLLQEQRRGATMVQIAAIALGRPLMGFFSADISPESYWLLGFWAARAARALHAARQLALCLSRGF